MGNESLNAQRPPLRNAGETAQALLIEGERVHFVLRRSARRSFALQVDHRGARVSVPLCASVAEIERFVHQHGRWLIERLRERAGACAPRPFEIVDGAQLPVLGRPLTLRLGAVRSAQWRDGAHGEELLLPAGTRAAAALRRALQARALEHCRARVTMLCARLGVAVPSLRLSNARTRWGSCSSRSGIRLHWRLIHLAPELIDYVAAHEVAHLVEMNHSPRFWAVVETLCPDWRAARLRLRRAGAGLPLIDDGRERGEAATPAA